MKVVYLTTYYNGEIDGRFGRFHDWMHTLRDMDDPPFESDIVALTASNPDTTLTSRPYGVLGEATELWGTPRNKAEFCLNIPRALRDLRRNDFDVLHVLTLDMIAYPVALIAADRHLVVGPDVMGYTPLREGPRWEKGGVTRAKDRVRFHMRKVLLRAADDPTLIALSQRHAANIRELDTRITPEVIPPGVDAIFSPDDRSRNERPDDAPTRFLYVGDLSVYKGYDLFLDALADLPTRVDFRARVIGSGDPDLDRIKEAGLADRVTVKGFVPRGELPEHYRWADFYVMPSIDENGPNTIVEALACGTPVIATDRPGTNEYAPEGAGIYVERTASALIEGLIEAHERREACAEIARSHADEFRAERTIEALAALYRDYRESE